MESKIPTAGVLSKSIHSGKWMFISLFLQKLIGLGSFIVLARYLKPEHYGVMASIFVIASFADNLTSHGLEGALTQKKGDVKNYLGTILTINLLKGLLVFLALFFLSGPLSKFFHAQEYEFIIGLSGLFILLPRLSSGIQTYLAKRLEFKRIFMKDFVGQIVYAAVSIYWVVWIDISIWALFWGHISRLIVSTVLIYAWSPISRAPSFQFQKIKKLFGRAKWLAGKNVIEQFLGVVDFIFVGRFLGAASLGFYSRASNLSSVAIEPLTAILTKVGFPAYSRIQDNLPRIQEGFLRTFDVLMAIAAPLSLLLILEGGAITQLMLGPRWGGIVLPLKILSVAVIFIALSKIVSAVFDGIGRSDINFRTNFFRLALSVALIFLGVRLYGIVGAAWGTLFASFLSLIYVIFEARKILKLGSEKFTPTIFMVSFSVFIVFLLEIIFRILFREYLGNVSILIWTAALGFVYMACLWWAGKETKSGPWHTLMVVFRELTSDFK